MSTLPVKHITEKELNDNMNCVDCENITCEAIDKAVRSLHCNHFNNKRQTLLNRTKQLFLTFPTHALTFLIVGDSISATRSVCLLARRSGMQL